jgi:hypothetical protein
MNHRDRARILDDRLNEEEIHRAGFAKHNPPRDIVFCCTY